MKSRTPALCLLLALILLPTRSRGADAEGVDAAIAAIHLSLQFAKAAILTGNDAEARAQVQAAARAVEGNLGALPLAIWEVRASQPDFTPTPLPALPDELRVSHHQAKMDNVHAVYLETVGLLEAAERQLVEQKDRQSLQILSNALKLFRNLLSAATDVKVYKLPQNLNSMQTAAEDGAADLMNGFSDIKMAEIRIQKIRRLKDDTLQILLVHKAHRDSARAILEDLNRLERGYPVLMEAVTRSRTLPVPEWLAPETRFTADPSVGLVQQVVDHSQAQTLPWSVADQMVRETHDKAKAAYSRLSQPKASDVSEWGRHNGAVEAWNDRLRQRASDLATLDALAATWKKAVESWAQTVRALGLGVTTMEITPVGLGAWFTPETLSRTPQEWPWDYLLEIAPPQSLVRSSWLLQSSPPARPASLAAGLTGIRSHGEALRTWVRGYAREARLAVSSLTAREAYDAQSSASAVVGPYAVSILTRDEMLRLRNNLQSIRSEAVDFEDATRQALQRVESLQGLLTTAQTAAQACLDYVAARPTTLPPGETLARPSADLSGCAITLPRTSLLDWEELLPALEGFERELSLAAAGATDQAGTIWNEAVALEQTLQADLDFNHELASAEADIHRLLARMDSYRSGYFGHTAPTYLYQSLRWINDDLKALLLPLYQRDPAGFPALLESVHVHADYVRSLGPQALDDFADLVRDIRAWTDRLIWGTYHYPGNVLWASVGGFAQPLGAGRLVFPENRPVADALVAARWSTFPSTWRTEMEKAGFLTPDEISLGLPRIAAWLATQATPGGTDNLRVEVLNPALCAPIPGNGLTTRLQVRVTDPTGKPRRGAVIVAGALPEAGWTNDASGVTDSAGVASIFLGPFTHKTSRPLSLLLGGRTVLSFRLPFDPDDDADGLPNAWESRFGLNAALDTDAGEDPDGDGLDHAAEFRLGTHPLLADTDADGVSDGEEVAGGSDPLDPRSGPTTTVPLPGQAGQVIVPAPPRIGQDWRLIAPPPVQEGSQFQVVQSDPLTLGLVARWDPSGRYLHHTVTSTNLVDWEVHGSMPFGEPHLVLLGNRFLVLDPYGVFQWETDRWNLIQPEPPWMHPEVYVAAWRGRVYVAAWGTTFQAGVPIDLNHVWSSADGIEWRVEFRDLPFLVNRTAYAFGVWKDTLVLGGGYRKSGKGSFPGDYFQDWYALTEEGGSWQAAAKLSWPPVGIQFRTQGVMSVAKDRMYLSGQVPKGTWLGTASEVWSTADGSNWSPMETAPRQTPILVGPGGLYALANGVWHSGFAFAETPGGDGVVTPAIPRSGRLAAGRFHVLALDGQNRLWGWGTSRNGGLGTPTQTDVPRPTLLDPAHHWTCVTAADNASLAVRGDGTLWAWGYPNTYALGLPQRNSPTARVQVGTDSDWSWVSTSGFHTLAIKTNGTLWAWGANDRGTLGVPWSFTDPDAFSIEPVQVGTDSDWVHARATPHCSIGIRRDGSAWQWGRYLLDASHHIPQRIHKIAGNNFTEFEPVLDVLQSPTFAGILTQDGRLYLRGKNPQGELGTGTTTANYTHADPVPSTAWAAAALNSVGTVAAIRWNNTLWTWGLRLGPSGTTNLVPRQVGSSADWVEIVASAGSPFFVARRRDGSLWAFGQNWDSVFGNGMPFTTVEEPVPVDRFDAFIPVLADADLNGLPDDWERGTAGTTGLDPDADDDQDGASTREEWLAGTHPRDAASRLRLDLVRSADGDLELQWPTASQRQDLLYHSFDLHHWRLVPTTGPGRYRPGPGVAETGGFFRLERGLLRGP